MDNVVFIYLLHYSALFLASLTLKLASSSPEQTYSGHCLLGVQTENAYKAYPVKILNRHEIVNDGDLLISYCTLCGTGMAFKIPDANFVVSGLLYNSDMLLYDRESHFPWSQILSLAISGERKGQKLKAYNIENTS